MALFPRSACLQASGRSGNSRVKPRSRRYAGTRGLARPAAAGYLLYFRCRFDTLDQGSRIPIKVQLKTGSSTQPRVDAARPAVHVQQQTRFATTLTRGPSDFDSWGICNVVHTFRVWARPSARSLIKRFRFSRSSRLTSRPVRLTFNKKKKLPSYFWTGAARETGA